MIDSLVYMITRIYMEDTYLQGTGQLYPTGKWKEASNMGPMQATGGSMGYISAIVVDITLRWCLFGVQWPINNYDQFYCAKVFFIRHYPYIVCTLMNACKQVDVNIFFNIYFCSQKTFKMGYLRKVYNRPSQIKFDILINFRAGIIPTLIRYVPLGTRMTLSYRCQTSGTTVNMAATM